MIRFGRRIPRFWRTAAVVKFAVFPKNRPAPVAGGRRIRPPKAWPIRVRARNRPIHGVVTRALKSKLALREVAGVSMAARGRTTAPLWCKDGPVRDFALMQQAWIARKGEMPPPRPLNLPEMIVQPGHEREAFDEFMQAFGGGTTARVTLPSGDVVVVSDDLFRTLGGRWKIGKREGGGEWREGKTGFVADSEDYLYNERDDLLRRAAFVRWTKM